MNIEAGALVASVREEAGLTQRQAAKTAKLTQSRVSRLEAGEGDVEDYINLLAALDTGPARSAIEKMRVEWRHLPRPSLRHPDFDSLLEIERALEKMARFLEDEEVPQVLAGQAELLMRRLREAGSYLLSLDHDVVYVGEIGVGKTTAACRQAGLVQDEATAADLKGMLLDTGGGRTTLCDVRVETGDRFSIDVDPLPDEEIYKLVSETCRGIHQKITGKAEDAAAEFKPAEEVERALRNMAGLPRPSRPKKGAEAVADPAVELAKEIGTLDGLTAEFAQRLSLWRRSRRSIEFDGADPVAGRQWLKSTFTSINNGRHADFSLPGHITVTVPFGLLPDDRLAVTITDTRGVDGSAVRTDILAHLKNERAVTLLCSKWGSAPDPSLQDLLKHVAETDADRSLLARTAIVALARPGDALSMRDDSGQAAEDVEDGYYIKQGQIEDALLKVGITGVATLAYDAASEPPQSLIKFVLERIGGVRHNRAEAARTTIHAVDEMLANVAQAQALAALETVNRDLQLFADRHKKLPKTRRPAYERLLQAILSLHARTVWAATRRSGSFWNFDVFQYLGDGAAAEAKLLSTKVVEGLVEIVALRCADPELKTTYGFLEQVVANVRSWEADFVNAARHHAIAVYRAPLARAQAVWDECEDPYGRGLGQYREHVVETLREWFDDNSEMQEELERRIKRAWRTTMIEPLLLAAGARQEGK